MSDEPITTSVNMVTALVSARNSPVTVVVEFVIAGEGYEDAKTCSEGVEDLCGGIDPDLGEETTDGQFGLHRAMASLKGLETLQN